MELEVCLAVELPFHVNLHDAAVLILTILSVMISGVGFSPVIFNP